jgi:hypothetical protein
MDYLTDPTFHRTSEWCEFATDTYLDHRHPNWVLAEEFGDVVFVAERDVVLVHRERAEHIVRALGADREAAALLTEVVAPPTRTLAAASVAIHQRESRWRSASAWLGILAGAAVFVAALAVPLDDPALVVALMLALRGGRVTATA